MPETVPREEHAASGEYYPISSPFLFYDRVLECTEISCTVLKNVTRNEWCAASLSPQGYCYSPSLFLECLAQAAGVLDEHRQNRILPLRLGLIRVKRVAIKKLPAPGDQVFVTATFLKVWKNMVMYRVEAVVEEVQTARANIIFVRY